MSIGRLLLFIRLVGTVVALAPYGSANAQPLSCPTSSGDSYLVFPNGAILMQTGLEVNPDGAAASYTPGDHGYTYIRNGVNLSDNGSKVSCRAAKNAARCNQEWARAEKEDFGPGTQEFCVFAMEVEPIAAGNEPIACEGSDAKYVVGNGKGRPKMGAPIQGFAGGTVIPYLSTTSLKHTRGSKAVYVDSATIPALVAPTDRADLVGAIAWVRYRDRETFAIVNDTGPSFGEGSVALHQVLQSGEIGPSEPVGPIPVGLRCSPGELNLHPPFVSKPDVPGDRCRAGHTAISSSDIRAYQGIGGGVTAILLAGVRPPMRGGVVTEEVTPARMRELAVAAGYTPEKLRMMAQCLRQ